MDDNQPAPATVPVETRILAGMKSGLTREASETLVATQLRWEDRGYQLKVYKAELERERSKVADLQAEVERLENE